MHRRSANPIVVLQPFNTDDSEWITPYQKKAGNGLRYLAIYRDALRTSHRAN